MTNLEPEEKTETVIDKLEDLKSSVEEKKNEAEQKKDGRKFRTGKKAEQQKAEEEAKDFSENMSGIGASLMSMITIRMPNPLPLNAEEEKQINWAVEKVLYKYINIVGEYKEEFALFSVAGMILLSRTNLLQLKPVMKKDE